MPLFGLPFEFPEKSGTFSRDMDEHAGRGLRPERKPAAINGFPVLPIQPGAQPVTSEHVADLLNRADRDDGRAGTSDLAL